MSSTAPPLCKVCGQNHWNRDGHIFYVTVRRGQVVPKKKATKRRKGHA